MLRTVIKGQQGLDAEIRNLKVNGLEVSLPDGTLIRAKFDKILMTEVDGKMGSISLNFQLGKISINF